MSKSPESSILKVGMAFRLFKMYEYSIKGDLICRIITNKKLITPTGYGYNFYSDVFFHVG